MPLSSNHRRAWATFLVGCLPGFAGWGGVLAADDDLALRRLLRTYCYDCHSSQKHKGDFDLEILGQPVTRATDADQWELTRTNLAELGMPPKDAPQPSAEERDRLIAWINQGLDALHGTHPRDPGSVTVHRLTQTEFNRTIADLLGIAGDHAKDFPPDNAGGSGGFEHFSDSLYVTSTFIERLLPVALALVTRADPKHLMLVRAEANAAGQVSPGARRKAATESLTGFLPRAWRRPVTQAEVRSVLRVYDRALKRKNVTPEDALRLAYASALVSPHFLYRIEVVKPGPDPYALAPYEMASRLSYFLWSSMPDAGLFAAAADGSLNDPQVLMAQAERMLADPRAEIMGRHFIGQWLGTEAIAAGAGPDPREFRAYSESLRWAMMEEPVLFFQALLRENRTLLELIDANYVYANAELARHYGLAPPRGEGFARIPVTDGQRGGVITMAGVLAITSRPARTSPVLRGKWILEELLSAPPPPPPPDVPALPEDAAERPAAALSLRQALEKHSANPACRSCHQRIDPLGFGLENFDATGAWRVRDEERRPLDTIGTLPTGERFSNPQELKAVLMKRKDQIVTTVVERMLSYALGRPIQRSDRPTVKEICTRLAADGYRARTLIREIVVSQPFRMRRNPDAQMPAARPPATERTP